MRVPIWFRITAALWAAVFLFIAFTLPPSTRRGEAMQNTGACCAAAHVRKGAFHIHTVASDGGGTRDDVARAAAAAGLDFVILTDHGDGTSEPAPPEYLHNVLVIDGVEVTSLGGHYAAFGLTRAPYPLGGPAYAVIEDVARLGGFGVAAHPDSTKPDLRWRDWNAPADGLEWINGDSAWRDESAAALARGIVDFIFRPGPALAGLVERPSRLLQRLDETSRSRRVVALAAADAHARLPLTSDEEPQRSRWTVPAPSYLQSFRTFANLVETDGPRSGDAAADAAAIMRAVREARVTAAMHALAEPSQLAFVALRQTGSEQPVAHPMGSRLPSGQVTFEARTSDVVKSGRSLVRLELRRNGRVVATSEGPSLTHTPAETDGVWRVEATLAHRPDVPWLLSNPIVVGESGASGLDGADPRPEVPRAAPGAVDVAATGEGGSASGAASLDLTSGPWAIEKHPTSEGRIEAAGTGVSLVYRLAPGLPAGQYVAAARPSGSSDGWADVVITARADKPTRLWVQLRLSDSGTGQRWGRSIYLDETSRTIRIPLRIFSALEPRASTSRPNVAQVRAVLLVVDTTSNEPGRAGRIVVEQLRLGRSGR